MKGERLKALRESKKLTREELGSMVGASSSAVWRWENNDRNASDDKMLEIAKALGASVSYLLGEVDFSGSLTNYNEDSFAIERRSDFDSVYIPVVGSDRLKTEDSEVLKISSYMPLPKFLIKDISLEESQDLRIIKMIGDSMEPRYNDGDCIIYKQTMTGSDGDNVVAIYKSKACVRWLIIKDNIKALRSLNKNYPDITGSETDPIYIQGKVLSVIPHLKKDGGFY